MESSYPFGRGAVISDRRWTLGCFLTFSSLILAGCASGSASDDVSPLPQQALAQELDAEGLIWVEETLSSLSLREAIGQLIIPWMPGAFTSTTGPEFQEYARYVEEAGVGGVSISIGLPHSYGAKLNALQARAKVPLLVTSDFENGGPGMRINHSYARASPGSMPESRLRRLGL